MLENNEKATLNINMPYCKWLWGCQTATLPYSIPDRKHQYITDILWLFVLLIHEATIDQIYFSFINLFILLGYSW